MTHVSPRRKHFVRAATHRRRTGALGAGLAFFDNYRATTRDLRLFRRWCSNKVRFYETYKMESLWMLPVIS